MKLVFVLQTRTDWCPCCGGTGLLVQHLVLDPGRRPWRGKVRVPCVHCSPDGPHLPLLAGGR